MKNNVKKVSKSIAVIALIFVLAVSLGSSFAVCNIISENSAQTQLEKNIEKTVTTIDNFEYSVAGKNTVFTDKLYSKANLVASYVNEKTSSEELEKLARYLYLDSIQITDTEGAIVASYPSDLKGGNIADNEDTKAFRKVIKGVSFKSQSPAKAVDGGYFLYTCVGRPEGKGVVIISSTEDNYGEILGENIADNCNDNTVIAKGDHIISSSFDENDKSTLSEMGVTEDKLSGGEFTLEVNGKNYLCKTQSKDNYTILCAVPQSDIISQNMSVVLIAIAVDTVALIIAVVVIMLVGRKKV